MGVHKEEVRVLVKVPEEDPQPKAPEQPDNADKMSAEQEAAAEEEQSLVVPIAAGVATSFLIVAFICGVKKCFPNKKQDKVAEKLSTSPSKEQVSSIPQP